jgi:hypothetical protein
MSIESDWRAIEVELGQRSPRILADLRPPITEAEASRWSAAVGDLPGPLRELYAVHAGTGTRGAGGFSLIGEWYPLTVDEALVRYEQCRHLAEIWGQQPVIPFAVDPSGSYLAVHPGGDGELNLVLDDAPSMPYTDRPRIETLLAGTVEGLRGNTADWRAELTEQYLSWINLEEEADDLGY